MDCTHTDKKDVCRTLFLGVTLYSFKVQTFPRGIGIFSRLSAYCDVVLYFFSSGRKTLGENCSRAFAWKNLIYIKKNFSLRLENVLVCDLYFQKFAMSAVPIKMLSLDAEVLETRLCTIP
jgi:hypothetical protein